VYNSSVAVVVLARSDVLNELSPDERELSCIAVGIRVSSVISRIAVARAKLFSIGSSGGIADTEAADLILAEAGVGFRGLGRWKAGCRRGNKGGLP
jgi:hypothetical protein